MEDVVLFTRQRGETSTASEQEALGEQIRIIEAFAQDKQLRIVDRVARVGIGADELSQELAAYLREHTTVRAIITYSMDRLCRGTLSFLEVQAMMKDRSIKLYLALLQEVITVSSPLTMREGNSPKFPLGYYIVDDNLVVDSMDAAVRKAFRHCANDGDPDGHA